MLTLCHNIDITYIGRCKTNPKFISFSLSKGKFDLFVGLVYPVSTFTVLKQSFWTYIVIVHLILNVEKLMRLNWCV